MLSLHFLTVSSFVLPFNDRKFPSLHTFVLSSYIYVSISISISIYHLCFFLNIVSLNSLSQFLTSSTAAWFFFSHLSISLSSPIGEMFHFRSQWAILSSTSERKEKLEVKWQQVIESLLYSIFKLFPSTFFLTLFSFLSQSMRSSFSFTLVIYYTYFFFYRNILIRSL